jgi:predicted nucleic acid-binding protein
MMARWGARATKTRAAGVSSFAVSRGVLLDTGALVALYARDDPKHSGVVSWLATFQGELHTVEAVLTEAAYFVPVRTRATIADLAASGRLTLHHPDADGHLRMASLFAKYADIDPDWADLALVWLAEATGISRIATLDVADFSVYRIHGRKRFELELLR